MKRERTNGEHPADYGSRETAVPTDQTNWNLPIGLFIRIDRAHVCMYVFFTLLFPFLLFFLFFVYFFLFFNFRRVQFGQKWRIALRIPIDACVSTRSYSFGKYRYTEG